MSFWKKLFGPRDVAAKPPPPVPPRPSAAPKTPEGPPPTTVEGRLLAMASNPVAEEANAVRYFLEIKAQGKGARALDLARRVLESRPEWSALSFSVAEVLSARGDDQAALQQIAARLRERVPSLAVLMLAAEIKERLGEREEAMGLYQKILARDLDYPRAKERLARLREEHSAPTQELSGQTIATDGALTRGRFRIERELGRGGAGTVFAAMDLPVSRRVALKVYHRRGPIERERLLVEARVPAKIEHPGVVRIFDLDEGLGAIAMEWVRGGSVKAELARETVTPARVDRWVKTLVDVLAYVHASGYVHRDIKPSNLLLRETDRVVLTDFGLALPVGAAPPRRAGGGEGTLQYMPKEQRHGAPAHPAQDVHALGITLVEIFAGLSTGVPASVQGVVDACRADDPAARPSLGEIRAAFSS